MSALVTRRRRPSSTLGENALGQTLEAGHPYAAVPRRMIGLDLAQVLEAILAAGRCGGVRVFDRVVHYCLLPVDDGHATCGWVRPVNLGGPILLERQLAAHELDALAQVDELELDDGDPFAEEVLD